VEACAAVLDDKLQLVVVRDRNHRALRSTRAQLTRLSTLQGNGVYTHAPSLLAVLQGDPPPHISIEKHRAQQETAGGTERPWQEAYVPTGYITSLL
jgi:hypothetical protein